MRLPRAIALVCVAAAVAVSGGSGATSATEQITIATTLPSVQIVRVTVDRTAQTVDLRLRICFSSGPRALIAVSERRTLRGVVQASSHWVPRAVEPARIFPYACRSGWRMNWLLKPGLNGPGTYAATIRVRDALGRWTSRVGFNVTSP